VKTAEVRIHAARDDLRPWAWRGLAGPDSLAGHAKRQIGAAEGSEVRSYMYFDYSTRLEADDRAELVGGERTQNGRSG
jgi:hypothetical protein